MRPKCVLHLNSVRICQKKKFIDESFLSCTPESMKGHFDLQNKQGSTG